MLKAGVAPQEIAHLGNQLAHTPSIKPTFRYYDEALAKKLYARFADDIRLLNTWLPADTPLPTEAHCPQGFTTTWDKNVIDAEDLSLLLKRYKELLDRSTQGVVKKPSFFVRVKRYIKRKLHEIFP